MPGPVFLAGERVTLRPARSEDADFLLENRNDPAVRAGRTAQYPSGPDDVEPFLGGTMGRNDESVGLLVCVDERPVGWVLINRERMGDSEYDRGELAYWITPDGWGNGYATEASRVLLDHCFDGLGLHKVVARSFESNEGSQRVIEKLGFTREGTFRDEAYVDGAWEDYYRYGLLREEWRESRRE
ncbi:GNAT family N-acetyltransferase [Halosimplex sp. J119]